MTKGFIYEQNGSRSQDQVVNRWMDKIERANEELRSENESLKGRLADLEEWKESQP